MRSACSACSDDQLLSLLDEDQPSDGLREALRHLESCGSCQERLERLAADRPAWHEARRMLSLTSAQGTEFAPRCSRRPLAWTESMARQLLAPPVHPEMLGRIGRYDVERLIGSGGMGIVFKAFDTELNRPVAVKVLAPYLAGSGAARQRFAREARAAAAVVHEHVVAIHNVESDGPAPFLVMPYVAGESLQQRLDREGPLELCEILRIALQTASGLAAAHAQGLVHRDVKPSNVLLEQGVERALLTDFGLARATDDASLTHTGYHPGTPQYMSPEQARGESLDARSDLFSLGSVLYTMCTGRPPFRADTSYGVLRRIIDEPPRPMRESNPGIPAWLESFVQRLHAKSPDRRFQSAEEVRQRLQQCLAHVQQPTRVPLPACCRPESRGQRKWWWPRWVALVLITLAAGGGLMAWGHRDGGNNQARHDSVPTPAGHPDPSLATQHGSHSPATSAATFAAIDAETPSMHDSGWQEGALDGSAWDATATQLQSLSQELAPLEARSRELWDERVAAPLSAERTGLETEPSAANQLPNSEG